MEFRLEQSIQYTTSITADTIEQAHTLAKVVSKGLLDVPDGWHRGAILYADEAIETDEFGTYPEGTPEPDGYERIDQQDEASEVPFWLL